MAIVPALGSQISAPQQYAVLGNPPTTLYFGEEMQTVSYSQYKSSPSLAGANSLWIKGATAWTQYAVVPLGATVSLLTISPVGGSGFFTIDGQTGSNNYIFYPNSLLTFYAGEVGRHMLSFAIDGQPSNQVVIDVTNANYIQPSNYPSPTNNYPWYYPWYYPWDYYPESYCGAGYHLENGQCVPDHRRHWGNRSP